MNTKVFEAGVHGEVIPAGWDKVPGHGTRSELLASRRGKQRPHMSFDLDKDGFVSQYDFKISHAFDKDKDNRLNTAEKKNALNYLKDTNPKRYYEKGGEDRPETAPMNTRDVLRTPQGTVRPTTRTELKTLRRENDTKALEAANTVARAKIDAEFRAKLKDVQPNYAGGGPGRVWSVIQDERKKQNREDIGLTRIPQPVNKARPPPPELGYSMSPANKTRSGMMKANADGLWQSLQTSLKETSTYFKPAQQKLQEREDASFVERELAPKGASREDLLQSRRDNMVSEMDTLFGAEKVYEPNQWTRMEPESRPGFWTLSSGYDASPMFATQSSWRQEKQFWKRKLPEGGPAPPVLRHPSDYVRLKTATINDDISAHIQTRTPPQLRAQTTYSKARQDPSIRKKTGEDANDSSPEATMACDIRALAAPLYSSFSMDGTFNPPRLPKARPYTSQPTSASPFLPGSPQSRAASRRAARADRTLSPPRQLPLPPSVADTLAAAPAVRGLATLSLSARTATVRSGGFQRMLEP